MYYSKLRILIVPFLSFFSAIALDAQILKRDTTEPKKEVEVIQFGEDGERSGRVATGRHILKVAPLSFLAGYFPIFYEREMTDWMGIQVAAGLTFKPAISDLQAELYSEFYGEECEDVDCSNYYDYTYRNGKISYMLGLSPRFYYSSDGLDGGYIAPEIRYYNRKSEAQRPDPASQYELVRLEDEFDEETVRYTDLMIQFGWQTLYPNLSLDMSLGLGVRKVSGNWQVIYQTEHGYYYSDTPEQEEYRVRLDVGLRVGFQL